MNRSEEERLWNKDDAKTRSNTLLSVVPASGLNTFQWTLLVPLNSTPSRVSTHLICLLSNGLINCVAFLYLQNVVIDLPTSTDRNNGKRLQRRTHGVFFIFSLSLTLAKTVRKTVVISCRFSNLTVGRAVPISKTHLSDHIGRGVYFCGLTHDLFIDFSEVTNKRSESLLELVGQISE